MLMTQQTEISDQNDDIINPNELDIEGPTQHGGASFIDGNIVQQTSYPIGIKTLPIDEKTKMQYKMLKTSKFELISKPERLNKKSIK